MARAVHRESAMPPFPESSIRRLVVFTLATLATVATVACRPLPDAPKKPYDVVVRVTGDPEEPLGELGVRAGNASALTDDAGAARLRIPGEDGLKIDLDVVCPPGFALRAAPPKITLLRTDRAPEYGVTCHHLDRGILVALRSQGAVDVPILYLEQEIARTDEEGYALVRLEPKVGETVTLTFDTSDERFRFVRPESPERSLAVTDSDGIYTIEQSFVVDRPRAPAASKPRVAKRLE